MQIEWVTLGIAAASVTLSVAVGVLSNQPLTRTALLAIIAFAFGLVAVAYVDEIRQEHRDSAGSVSADHTRRKPAESSTSSPPTHHQHEQHGSAPTQVAPSTAPTATDAATELASSSPATPSPALPASVPSPLILDYTTLAQVPAGMNVSNFCATVRVPAGHPGLLFFSTTYGRSVLRRSASAERLKRCTTYTAPDAKSVSEDRLRVRLVDEVTDKAVQRTEVVPIPEDPTPPA